MDVILKFIPHLQKHLTITTIRGGIPLFCWLLSITGTDFCTLMLDAQDDAMTPVYLRDLPLETK